MGLEAMFAEIASIGLDQRRTATFDTPGLGRTMSSLSGLRVKRRSVRSITS
jgi:hypothetical protein